MTDLTDSALRGELRRFKAYSEYKNSGVEWLGEIPVGWDVVVLKRVALIQNGADHKHIEVNEGYPVIGSGGPFSFASDFMYDGESVLLGRKGTVDKPLYISGRFWTVDTMYWTKIVEGASARFVYYVALTIPFDFYSTNTALPSMTQSALGNHAIAIPAPREQRTIATFLDRETARIDALVAKKERLITLLQERRTALITRAVTKGLDPAAPLTDSGVEWLGEIPAHWTCLALARATLSRCDGPFGSGLKSEHYSTSGVRVVRLQNIGWTRFDNTDAAYVDELYARQLGDHSVRVDDLLIAGLGDEGHPVGRACVAPQGIEPAMVKADCFRFRLERRLVHPRFAAYQLSITASAAAGSLATGATRARMNLTTTASRKLALPPLSEQQRIVDALDQETKRYGAMIDKVMEAVARLAELRTALISATVTGKIDVRDTAQ